MNSKIKLIKKYMTFFSTIENPNPTWSGYKVARQAKTEEERQEALLDISMKRYQESKQSPLDQYFRCELKQYLKNADLLEIGSNHGGTSLAYLELYELRSIRGLETTKSAVETSNLFLKKNAVTSDYDFIEGFGENMPFSSNVFDAIISFDVFEHVQNLERVMNECYRVLKPNGMLFSAFPSYYHPTEHHLSAVTLSPCIHWFFSPSSVMAAYNSILSEHQSKKHTTSRQPRELHSWEKLTLINGTTLKQFRRIISKNNWSQVKHIPLPLGTVGKLPDKFPILKPLKYITSAGTKYNGLGDICNHRIVHILTK